MFREMNKMQINTKININNSTRNCNMTLKGLERTDIYTKNSTEQPRRGIDRNGIKRDTRGPR